MPRRRIWLLAVAAVVGACNFRPLYLATGPDNTEVRSDLAAIELRGPEGRLGYLVRDALLEELNPASLEVPPRYALSLRLSSTARALGIQLDSTITRYNLYLTATFELRELAADQVLVSSSVRRVASYNVSREPFADLTAAQTAESRAARELAADIRTMLAVQFARTQAVT